MNGCIQPSKARIDFANHASKDVQQITLITNEGNFVLGNIQSGKDSTWTKKLVQNEAVDVVVEFSDKTKLSHHENFFNNHRYIKIEIEDQKLVVRMVYEGFL